MLDNISNVDFSVMLQVESMKKKLPWLKYDMKKAEYMEAKEHEKDAKEKLDEAAKTLNDLKEPIALSMMTYLWFTRCVVLNIYIF